MLLVSQWGWHAKISSLLDDPAITSELHTFMRSSKWSMDPQKLAKFTNNKLLYAEAAKYVEGLGFSQLSSSSCLSWVQPPSDKLNNTLSTIRF
ncbi:hypothetical protein EV702DRAFT_1199775 [Suillus placidus]|uniref:Uncharacterized protein n=1 Tax=Suillus placidus TaxID=48579 RepID=A0A9P6ZR19_9AGAM|nr:hypothetical protein EV702DRAFT_1199775 [Suillus placidus]